MESSEQVQALEAELQAVKAKLAKTEASKQRLKEHWALLKEKVINAHTLCDERDELLKQLDAESATRADLQQQLQEARKQKAAVDKECAAAKNENQRLDKLLDAAAAQKQEVEKRLAQAVKAADHVKQQHQGAMHTMQQQVHKLQHVVEQLQQQQVVSRLADLERNWQHLVNQEHTLTVDQQELNRAVKPPLQQLLQQQMHPRLAELEHRLVELQQWVPQQQQAGLDAEAAAVAVQPEPQPPQEQLASLHDVSRLQQLLEAVVTEHQQLRAAFQHMQQQLMVLQGGKGQQLETSTAKTWSELGTAAGAASVGASREASSAAPSSAVLAARPTPAGCHPSAAAAGQSVVRALQVQQQSSKPSAAGTGSAAQSTRGSSMFGTTMLNIGGFSSSYSYGDQAGSPSEGSVQQQSQQQVFVGRKRAREQQQLQLAHDMLAPALPGVPPAAIASSIGGAAEQPRLPASGAAAAQPQQQEQHWQQYTNAVDEDDMPATASSSSGSETEGSASDSGEQSPKCRRLSDHQRQRPGRAWEKPVSKAEPQQHQQPQQVTRQQKLAGHFQAVTDQQADAAGLAQQVAQLVLAGKLRVSDIVQASCNSFLSVAAAGFDVEQLQQQATLLQGHQLQKQLWAEAIQQLGCVGWASAQHGPAKVAIYQQRVAAYVQQLSDLLQQHVQLQRTVGDVGSVSLEVCTQQPGVEWPAAAACWQQLLQELLCSSGSLSDRPQKAAAVSVPEQPESASTQRTLLQQVVERLMAPVHAACRAFALPPGQQQQYGRLWVQQQAGTTPAEQQPMHPQQQQQYCGQQQSDQQQLPIAQACAATAAAVRLLRAANDKQGCHCVFVKLACAAAQHVFTQDSSSNLRTHQHTGLPISAGSMYSLGCLLAAIAAWTDALRLDASVQAGPDLRAADTASEVADANAEQQSWQLVVLDPVLAAVRSCLGALAEAAARCGLQAGAAAPGESAGDSVGCMEDAAAAGTVGAALQLVLQHVNNHGRTRTPASRQGHVAAGFHWEAQEASAGEGIQHCKALGPDVSQARSPVDLLSKLLGVVKLLLQKQHPALPRGCLVASGDAVEACVAGLCVAVHVGALLVQEKQRTELLCELRTVLADGIPQKSAACLAVQRMLDHLFVRRSGCWKLDGVLYICSSDIDALDALDLKRQSESSEQSLPSGEEQPVVAFKPCASTYAVDRLVGSVPTSVA